MTNAAVKTSMRGEAAIILVVDDSPESLGLLNETLEDAGFSVLVALEGKQALTIARRIKPDLVLLDAVMPGMDGFETCAALLRLPQMVNVPIVFMTGLNEPASVVRGLQSGSVDYLVKPVSPEELLARIDVHLKNARRTNSVYSALDSTGQMLFAANSSGHLLWATVQTRAGFSRLGLGEVWKTGAISSRLKNWLGEDPRAGDVLTIDHAEEGYTGEGAAGFMLIDAESESEVLLRLVEVRSENVEALFVEKLGLTERESQVLRWISSGKTNWEIGQILEVSPRTVNKHLEQIFPKLGVQNRTAAARVAMELVDRYRSVVR